jgi:hypothetical protein
MSGLITLSSASKRLIGEQHAHLHVRQQFVSPHQIVDLATGQMEANRIAEGVNQGIDLDAESAARRPIAWSRPSFF